MGRRQRDSEVGGRIYPISNLEKEKQKKHKKPNSVDLARNCFEAQGTTRVTVLALGCSQ